MKKDIIRGSKAERKVLVAEKKNGAQKIRRRDNTLATVRALLEVEKRKARRFESQLSKLRSQKVGTAVKQSATEALKNKLQHCKDDNVGLLQKNKALQGQLKVYDSQICMQEEEIESLKRKTHILEVKRDGKEYNSNIRMDYLNQGLLAGMRHQL